MNRKLSLWFFSIAIIGLLCTLVVEASLRGLISLSVGPQVLLYGTSLCCGPKARMMFDPKEAKNTLRAESHTVNFHRNKQGDYSKYFPNEELVEFDQYGDRFPVQTNAKGFRGRDFEVSKTPGVIRVVMLGASSTFGYHDRDNETYPFYTEEILNARILRGDCEGVRSFEVINLGIPHQTSQMILALFRAEGLPLRPDFVTFYEGINDTQIDIDRLGTRNAWDDVPLYYKFVRRLRKWVLTFALIDNLLTINGEKFSEADLQHHLQGKLERFLKNLEMIQQDAKTIGAEFIAANQQAKSEPTAKQSELRGITYADELEAVKLTLHTRGWVGRGELHFLTHAFLMDGLRDWSQRKGAPFVDAINAMDSRRDLLLSWVHLAPEGNRIIAQKFADAILQHACPASMGAPAELD